MSEFWSDRWNTLIKKTFCIASEEDLSQKIQKMINPESPFILAFINAHALNETVKKPIFYNALIDSDTLLRDGSGIALLYKKLGLDAGLNMNGTDLIPKILSASNGKKIALYGTQEPYLTRAKKKINHDLMPQSPLYIQDGFQEASVYIEKAKKDKPDIILLAMGMPKQELIAQQLKKELEMPCLIICGGAIADFLAGRVLRAPVWMRKLGIEWLYRLMHEPKRLFKRYVIGNPLFIVRTSQLIRKNKHDQKTYTKAR